MTIYLKHKIYMRVDMFVTFTAWKGLYFCLYNVKASVSSS